MFIEFFFFVLFLCLDGCESGVEYVWVCMCGYVDGYVEGFCVGVEEVVVV